jgi:3-deoxy-D-manno-octulosonic-acid transferase
MLFPKLVNWLLNIFYLGVLFCAFPRLAYHYFVRGKYRGTLGIRLLGLVAVRHGSRCCAWFEAASLGEVKLIEPLVRQFQHQHPNWDCIVSASTSSGYVLAQRLFPDLYVFPLPVDFSWSVCKAVQRLRPQLLVLADSEFCPNLVQHVKRQKCAVLLVNGRMNECDFRYYRWIQPCFRSTLRQFDMVGVQSSEYARRFIQLGADPQRVRIVGSMKYSAVESDPQNKFSQHLRRLADIHEDNVVLMAGSTCRGEERVVLSAFQRLAPTHPRLRLILAPRHIDRCQAIAKLLQSCGIRWQLRSQLDVSGPDPLARILLVDTIGELGAWWGTCHIAWVGGSLWGGRGKNMIEPAAFGAAVAFGPDTSDFRNIVQPMLAARAAVIVHNEQELASFIESCLDQPGYRQEAGRRARQFVAARSGATERTLAFIDRCIAHPPGDASAAPKSLPSSARGSFAEAPTPARKLMQSTGR